MAGVHQVVDREPVDPSHLADVAEIQRPAVGAFEGEGVTEQDVGRQEVERHGSATVLLERGGEFVIEIGGKHLLDDRKRGIVGVAAALHPRGHDAGLIHGTVDRLPTAVHDHDPHAERRQEDDVDQQVAQRVGMLHHAATQFDDRGRVAELADPAESLDERIGLLDRLLLGLVDGGGGRHVAVGPCGVQNQTVKSSSRWGDG